MHLRNSKRDLNVSKGLNIVPKVHSQPRVRDKRLKGDDSNLFRREISNIRDLILFFIFIIWMFSGSMRLGKAAFFLGNSLVVGKGDCLFVSNRICGHSIRVERHFLTNKLNARDTLSLNAFYVASVKSIEPLPHQVCQGVNFLLGQSFGVHNGHGQIRCRKF